MKCHYEILGLGQECTPDELKKAYRKLALEWHPDKNLERLDEAKENFQLIQQAYDILSDPQERAWYDRHREDILRGGAEQSYKDESIDVFQYFNTGCFKGYNDSEKGFYTVYRQVFEKITAQDKPFMDDDEDMEIPQFGYSYSSYEEVVHNFYAYWQSYCTAKTFSWVDKFDLSEARKCGVGRQVIRAMEKENKKLRDTHKKLRNEEVRELVAFVRKRDKRVQAQKKAMEQMKAAKAKKAEELRRKHVQERKKAFADYEETEWCSMSQFENHFDEIESTLDATFGDNANDTLDNEGENENLGDLYCVACEKDFRSQKAFKNHENSKRHKENVLLLKTLMEQEELEISTTDIVEVTNDDEETESADSELEKSISSEALLDELIKKSTKSKRKKKKKKPVSVNADEANETDKLQEIQLEIDNVHIVEEMLPADELNDLCAKPTSVSSKKKGKKNKTSKNEIIENKDAIEKDSICGTCNNNFSSRNKLFEHLKQTGHAVYKNDSQASSSTIKKQRRKKP